MAKRTDGTDPLSGSGTTRPDGTACLSSSVAPEASLVCARVPLAKLTTDANVVAEGDLKSTDFSSGVPSLRTPGSFVASLSESDRASSAVPKGVESPTTTRTSYRTRKKIAPGGGKIKATVPLASFGSAQSASPSQSKCFSASRIKGARHLRSSVYYPLLSGNVDGNNALFMLSDREDFTGEASS